MCFFCRERERKKKRREKEKKNAERKKKKEKKISHFFFFIRFFVCTFFFQSNPPFPSNRRPSIHVIPALFFSFFFLKKPNAGVLARADAGRSIDADLGRDPLVRRRKSRAEAGEFCEYVFFLLLLLFFS